ncbi:hypothetical protein GYMLUDRAFT_259051 [Collybiopsis luxurians FD-317 M1]|uniref:Uncharacterized protein n=1 Tax=Collybiopsis luxurians FD-317 M1 TaxID=944289 RepID=A0A0D0CW79_9AGAR|nr:hypothetical protein GYMLUDRAFT_259051 [Collybiopsis luxurians FD-317 M1]
MASKAVIPKPSTALTTFTNHFRPHRGEALVRLRSNAFALISIFISTWLLPVPSVLSAMGLLSSKKSLVRSNVIESQSEWSVARIISTLELAIVGMLAYNIVEALYALKYPRESIKKPAPQGPFSPSPAKIKKPFSIISPNSTPTSKSKIFTYSPGQSLGFSQSRSPQYPPSPVASPSHIIRYSMPPKGGSSEAGINSSLSSSTSTIPPTPSPSSNQASAYRGKHASSLNGGRPMDGLFLSQMTSHEDEDEE